MIRFKFHCFYFCPELSSFSVVLTKQMEDNEAKHKIMLVRVWKDSDKIEWGCVKLFAIVGPLWGEELDLPERHVYHL